jgi:uncharacterized protein YjdB
MPWFSLHRSLLLAALCLAACSDDPDEPPGPPGPVATVGVSPHVGTLPQGLTLQLEAIARDSAGRVITGRRVAWSSTNIAAARVDTTGTVLGAAAGSATIVAVVGGKNASAEITVTINPVVTVEVTPSADSLKAGKTLQLTAAPKDAEGRSLQGRTVTWTQTGVANVDEDGLVSAFTPGSSTVSAMVDGVTGSAEITVYRLPIAEVVIDPRSRVLVVGDSFHLSWDLRDAEGDRIFNDEQPEWTSSNPAVAIVRDEPFNFSLEVLGTGTTTLQATVEEATGSEEMTVIPPTVVASLSTGGGGPCAVTNDHLALCWEAANPTGQGDKAVLWPRGPELAPAFVAVEAASGFRCGLTQAGVAECWGGLGLALGRGSADTSSIPAPAAGGLILTTLSASGSHTCALTASGAAYCWGLNSAGQLGAASTGQCDGRPCSLEPVALAGGLAFQSISAGAWHTCALTAGGKAYCWGRNAEGELGDGTIENRSEPAAVKGDLIFGSISAGGLASTPSGRTCGVTTTKVAYCWGAMVGDGTSLTRTEPTPVAGEFQWRDVRAGSTSSCGIVTTGDLYCWGDHRRGQLGTGNTAPSLVPALVAGGHSWTAVDPGSDNQSCGLTTDGVIYCWGEFLEVRTFTPIELPGQP